MASLLSYLVNAIWQSPAIILIALACGRQSRLAPQALHRLYVVALCAAAAAPAVAVDAHRLGTLFASFMPIEPRVGPEAALGLVAPLAAPGRLPLSVPGLPVSGLAASIGLLIAAAAASIAIARLCWGFYAIRRLLATSQRASLHPRVAHKIDGFCERQKMSKPTIMSSSQIACPMTAGVFNPTIIIPHRYFELESSEVEAALLHECGHVARRDFLINLILEIVMLPQSWNPLVHVLKSEIGRAREADCDAIASNEIGSRRRYAASLVKLASKGVYQRGLSPALPLIGHGQLERRVRLLLGPVARASAVRRTLAATLTTLGVVAVPFMHVEAATRSAEAPMPAISPSPSDTPIPPRDRVADTPAESSEAVRRAGALASTTGTRNNAADDVATVQLNETKTGYRHAWVGSSGRRYSIITNSPAAPMPAEQSRLEGQIDQALAAADRVRPFLASPEFRALQERLSHSDFRAQLQQATARLNDKRMQLTIERAEAFGRSDLARKLEEMSAKLNTWQMAAPLAAAEGQLTTPGARPDNTPVADPVQ